MKKIALITGTSSGFGHYTAKTLAAAGHHVYASMRDTRGKNLPAFNALTSVPNITPIEMDVQSEISVRTAILSILDKEGKIDVLVNNAGIGAVSLFEQFTLTEASRQMDTNFWGTVRCIKQVLPSMRKQKGGLIINVTSSLGRFAMPFFAYYCASKHAVEAVSEALRAELAMVGVDIAVVEPGAFPGTGFNASTRHNFPANREVAHAYGELAVNYPDTMMKVLDDMAHDPQTQNPQMVADEILRIIQTPSEQLQFRYVVDRAVGSSLGDYNRHGSQLHAGALQVLGLSPLLRYQNENPVVAP